MLLNTNYIEIYLPKIDCKTCGNCCKEVLHKNDFVSRLINVIGNIAICPIVLNVYEALKEGVWNNSEFEQSEVK